MKTSNKLLTGAFLLALVSLVAMAFYVKANITIGERINVTGTGEIVKDRRDQSPFNEISVYSPFEVELVQSNDHFVEVEAYENLQNAVVCDLKDGRLKVKFESGTSVSTSKPVKLVIGAPEINKIKIRGSVDFTSTGKMTTDSLKLSVEGASELSADIEAQYLFIDAEASSDVKISGAANSVIVECSSAASINGVNFTANTLNADIRDAATVKMTVVDKLVANVRNAGNISYYGDPQTNIETKNAGSATDLD